MKTKRILALSLLLIMCMSLSACHKDDIQSIAEQGYLFWTTSEELKEYYLQKQEEWNAANPQNLIRLTIETFSSTKIVSKLDSIIHGGALQVGEAIPDFVDLQWQALEQYLYPNRAYLFPTTALLEENNIPIINEFGAYCRNGLCYALPYGGNRLVLYCNDAALQEYGLAPVAIQDIDSLWEMAETYHRITGNPFLRMDSDSASALMMVLALAQSDTFSIEKAYDDVSNTLNKLQRDEIIEISYINSLDIGHICDNLQDESCAAYIGPLSHANTFMQKMPDMSGKLSIHTLPFEQETAYHVPNPASVVLLSCENIRLMKDFLSFARLSPDAQRSLSTLGLAYNEGLNCTDKVLTYYSNDITGLYSDANTAYYFDSATQYLPDMS